MRVVGGLDAIEAASSPAFVVVGVFDGLHRGHAYLLEHLVAEAGRRGARPVVITFDHHPDEVLTGSAPPILCDPDERIERLDAAGVDTTVIVHFDRALRETPYDAFVGRHRRPDAPRRLPDDARTRRSATSGPGRPRRSPSWAPRAGSRWSSCPRSRWTGARSAARRSGRRSPRATSSRPPGLLGRPHAVVGEATGAGEGSVLRFPLPVALPPQARYRVGIGTGSSGALAETEADVEDAVVRLPGDRREGRTRVAFIDRP